MNYFYTSFHLMILFIPFYNNPVCSTVSIPASSSFYSGSMRFPLLTFPLLLCVSPIMILDERRHYSPPISFVGTQENPQELVSTFFPAERGDCIVAIRKGRKRSMRSDVEWWPIFMSILSLDVRFFFLGGGWILGKGLLMSVESINSIDFLVCKINSIIRTN